MRKESTAGLMKISELAKATGTNVSTIKFYVKEGLVQAAGKTSPNMAYYHADCIARVKLIKSLQKEHYYPLSVIKHMISASVTNQTEMELLDAIHKADRDTDYKTFSPSEISKMTRLSRSQIHELNEQGIVKPDVSGKKQWYTESDFQIMVLLRRRMDAGIPFEESVVSFRSYEKALKEAAKADVDFFIDRALLTRAPSTEEAVHMISVSDETLDRFVSLKRKELNRQFGSERLEDLDHFASNLSAMLRCIGDSLEGLQYPGPAEQCHKALHDCPKGSDSISSALRYFRFVIDSTSGSLAECISICGQAHAYFISLHPEESEGIDSLLLYSLKLCWLGLAPSLLDCKTEARKTLEGFSSLAAESIEAAAKTFTQRVLTEMTRIGGVL